MLSLRYILSCYIHFYVENNLRTLKLIKRKCSLKGADGTQKDEGQPSLGWVVIGIRPLQCILGGFRGWKGHRHLLPLDG